ncbi:CBO0543 family protein [Bacillus suaedaesalsae]|uniref:CBO0543 family protein n=1 Tax=Bacillus suaedaesalsae TaxID=2810349 RepID=UPI003D2B5EA7
MKNSYRRLVSHLTLTIALLCFAFWKGDWRNWQKYALTIAYVIICNFLYNLLCKDYLLWEHKPDILPKKHYIVELFYLFIILPAITLIYLTHYPFLKKKSHQLLYIMYWVIGSIIIEFPFVKFERLLLKHGYEYWMEIFFYSAMYLMIRLHFTRPLLTYGISVICVVFMVWFFNVPLK